jgi:hypothetical protein
LPASREAIDQAPSRPAAPGGADPGSGWVNAGGQVDQYEGGFWGAIGALVGLVAPSSHGSLPTQ